MRLAELHPHWLSDPDPAKVIEEVGSESLLFMAKDTTDYYATALPLWQVLNYFGVQGVGPNSGPGYVPCKLASHGTADSHASAQYYTTDRETGQPREAVYCHKCQTMRTSYWFLRDMRRDFYGAPEAGMRRMMAHIWTEFRVPPPIRMWAEFDPVAYVSEFGGGKGGGDPYESRKALERAAALRKTKGSDPAGYLLGLHAILSGGLA